MNKVGIRKRSSYEILKSNCIFDYLLRFYYFDWLDFITLIAGFIFSTFNTKQVVVLQNLFAKLCLC